MLASISGPIIALLKQDYAKSVKILTYVDWLQVPHRHLAWPKN